MVERETSAEIEKAAALWAVRAEGDALDAGVEAELRNWLASDTRRLGAYARAMAMLAEAARVKALGPTFDPETYRIENTARARAADNDDDAVFVRQTSRRRFLIGGTAAVGVAATAGLVWPAAATTYSTKRGEVRLVPLADGSSMTLNTQTTAKVLFDRRERHVELVEGEILLNVSQDVRPFVVDAGASRVRANTTSFAVSRLPQRKVEVTVRQGSVQLTSGTVRMAPAVLQANMRAKMSPESQQVEAVSVAPSELTRSLAWQQGMLSFEDTPLDQAAEQFARYSDIKIRFDDPTISKETITGLYAANNPQGFARSAALMLGLRSKETDGAVTFEHSLK